MTVIVLRQTRQVTHASLFAFISELCPNRQVTGTEVDLGAAGGERDLVVRPVTGTEVDPSAAGLGVAAQVSLAVAAKASAENFPVALRVLPGRWLDMPGIRRDPPGPPPAVAGQHAAEILAEAGLSAAP